MALIRNINTTPEVMVSGTKAAEAMVLAAAAENANGVKDLSNGKVVNMFPIPSNFNVTISSNNGVSAEAKTMYLFNESFLNASPTNNGSGAASIVTTYGDGFSGRVYEQYIKLANTTRGIRFNGFTVQATNYTSGAQVTTPFASMSLALQICNGQGGRLPVQIDLNEAIRNTQYQSGILTVTKPMYVNALSQFQLSLPINTTLAFTFFTDASSF